MLSPTQKYLIRKIQFKLPQLTEKQEVFIRSNRLSFKFLKIEDNTVIDTSKCNKDRSTNLVYSIQLNKDDKYKLNIPLYRSVKDKHFDLFNSESEGYKSRCYNIMDPSSKADTTINYRINNYFQNLTVLCNDGDCEYSGINNSYFVNCQCNKEQDSIYYTFVNKTLSSVRTINLDVVTCPHAAFISVNIFLILGNYC